MKKTILIAISIILLLIVFSCESRKVLFNETNPRVEYSSCTGCKKCVDEFTCPQGAIKIIEKNYTIYAQIDPDKCTKCMKCIDVFKCEFKAIVTLTDTQKPGTVVIDSLVSDSSGVLNVYFQSPGDDGNTGKALKYLYTLRKTDNTAVTNSFVPDFPIEAGNPEQWTLRGLPAGDSLIVSITAVDEVDNYSAKTEQKVKISNELADTAPPAPITDLQTSNLVDNIILTWTATGDDGNVGTASSYEIRYSSGNIDETNWDSASIYSHNLVPKASGQTETLSIIDLTVGTHYKFAVKAIDEVHNISAMSNLVDAYITGDVTAPAAISLTASSLENNVKLEWIAPGDDGNIGTIARYELRYSTAPITQDNWLQATNIPANIIPASAGSPQILFVENITLASNFYFAIKAFDEANNASISNSPAAQITGDITAPAAITTLSKYATSSSAITLTWTAVGDNGTVGTATKYVIKYSTAAITSANWDQATTFATPPTPGIAGTVEYAMITGLTAGQTYYFGVKALDEAGLFGAISNIINAQTSLVVDTTPPAAITSLTVTSAAIYTANLQWTAPGDDGNTGTATQYQIKKYTQPITEANWAAAELLTSIPQPQIAGSIQSMVAQNLSPYTHYYFAIKALDDNNNTSLMSNIAETTTLQAPDTNPPATISNLTSVPGTNSTDLQWTAPGDDGNSGTAHHYEIRQSNTTITEANWSSATLLTNLPTPQAAGVQQSYNVPNLNLNTQYYFAIKAFDEAGNNSSLSNVVNYYQETADTTPPATITNLQIVVEWTTYTNRMKIKFTSPGDDGSTGTVDHYEIRYSSNPITEANWASATVFNSPPAPLPGGTLVTATVTGLTFGSVYYFAVKAYDEAGNVNGVSNSPRGKICYQIDNARCNGCGQCSGSCSHNALSFPNDALINPANCTACGDCVSQCPRNAIKKKVVSY